MTLLFLGIAAFFILHMIPFWGRSFRSAAIGVIGEKPYTGLFALATLGSFVMIVFGWKAADVTLVYDPPIWGMHVTALLVLIGFILFIASNAPTNIRRMIRHPQLTGVALWGIGHLLANGENRSVLLFTAFILYSIVAVYASNKRDGEWVKRDKVPFVKDVVTVVIALALYAGFVFWAHEWLFGVPVA